jgi:DNA-binding response OmpR family regulator
MKKPISTEPLPADAVRVLVIDDDADLSGVMVDALRERGLVAWSTRPHPSTPISNVVATAVLCKPHVVLIDVVMPVNTSKLVQALRSRAELADTLLVGCSGHALLATPFARHLDGFLHKPFSMRELSDAILELVGARKPVKPAKPVRSRSSASPRRRPRTTGR